MFASTLPTDATDIARSLGHTPESWQASGHVYHVYSGRFEINPYLPVGPPPPLATVAASSSKPSAPKESTPVGSDGLLLPGTRADALLRAWTAPVAAGKRAAATPLLIVGQSLWPPVTKVLRSLHAYPTSYDRLPVHELPTDETSTVLFRGNVAFSRVVMVFLPSVASAAAFAASRLPSLQKNLPQHSWVLFTLDNGAAELPSAVTDRYTWLHWRDAHPRLPGAASDAADSLKGSAHDPLRVIAASHARVGGELQPGRSIEQTLGLQTASARDIAWYHMTQAAAAQARHLNAVAGHFPKRLKTDHFDSKRVTDMALQGGAGDFGRNTVA